jgi:DNA-directed RNA polymerase specialized sigma24 family protein
LAELVESYIEPVLRFCLSRLASRPDAEDLAQKIFTQVLIGGESRCLGLASGQEPLRPLHQSTGQGSRGGHQL